MYKASTDSKFTQCFQQVEELELKSLLPNLASFNLNVTSLCTGINDFQHKIITGNLEYVLLEDTNFDEFSKLTNLAVEFCLHRVDHVRETVSKCKKYHSIHQVHGNVGVFSMQGPDIRSTADLVNGHDMLRLYMVDLKIMKPLATVLFKLLICIYAKWLSKNAPNALAWIRKHHDYPDKYITSSFLFFKPKEEPQEYHCH
ncbi:unnamed protein product [Ambrosiozyma monospora]|uniref:Unnamed protein product n=1 Tax=Ambrosiozyma monospora TaxID=43982 RepID=A0A9W7DD02_AMBMO|nr:unnamed protein product [Ambrosiozyma monospora]